MKLMVVFKHPWESYLHSFRIMESDEFTEFRDSWLKYLKVVGEIFLEIYPFDTVYCSTPYEFDDKFVCYEISEYEISIFKKVFPHLENQFPEYAPETLESEPSIEFTFAEDEIPF